MRGSPLHVEVRHLERVVLDELAARVSHRADVPQARAAANAEGWPVSAVYPLPLYEQPLFRKLGGYEGVRCPVAEDLCRRSGTWTTHEKLLGTEEDMGDIVQIAEKIKANAAALRASDL